MPDQFIEKCKQEIAGYQSMLAPLEAGEIRLGEPPFGDPDPTQARIEQIKALIAMLQSIVDRDNANRS
ncbi:MAG: hypothetical protein WA813_02870 [Beijerinckiaceae bacterium]